MALRKLATVMDGSGTLAAKVYRDAEWSEYRVRFFRNGVLQTDSDYHTDDAEDAMSTARTVLGETPARP